MAESPPETSSNVILAHAVFATVAYEDLNELHRQSVQAAEALAEDEKRLLVSTD